jgi:hypothetical protein
MTGIRYLTDEAGNPKAVVLPMELWRRLLPRDDASLEELTEAVEDHWLNRAMDSGRCTSLLTRAEALKYLGD